MSFSAPSPPMVPPTPAAPPPPPVFGQSPIGAKPQAKSNVATFLGGMSVPSTGPASGAFGGKTLLGT